VVVLLAFVLVYPTLHSYLEQRVELDRLRSDVAAAQQRNEDLAAELDRWDDSAYVTAQARERLAFVLPGETAFRVEDPETVPEVVVEQPSDVVDGVLGDGATLPWYSTVWESVQVAGEAEVTGGDGSTGDTAESSGAGTDEAGESSGTDEAGESSGTDEAGENGTEPAAGAGD